MGLKSIAVKFTVGDRVWVMDNNRPQEVLVSQVLIHYKHSCAAEMALGASRISPENPQYHLLYEATMSPACGGNYLSGDRMFSTKAELISSL